MPDIRDYSARVGAVIGASSWMEVPQAAIDAFADAVGDHQFIHVDPARAAETPFGGTIAHGFLTLSLMSAMIYEVVPEVLGPGTSVNAGLDRVRFISPVRPGARVRGVFLLTEHTEPAPDEIRQTWDVTVEIEDAEKPALVARWLNRKYLPTAGRDGVR